VNEKSCYKAEPSFIGTIDGWRHIAAFFVLHFMRKCKKSDFLQNFNNGVAKTQHTM
jgi:hypothetical protein